MEGEDKDKFVCAFDGELTRVRDGKRCTIAELLIRHIQSNPFYLDPSTTPRSDSPRKRIEEVLYSFYYQTDTQGLNVKISNRKEISFTGYGFMPADEAKLFQDNRVLDLTKSNLRSNEIGTISHTKGTLTEYPGRGIAVTCGGLFFYTDYDSGLYDLLTKIGVWIVFKGALKAVIGKVTVPFASIVWAYHHGLISDDVETGTAIVAAHKHFTEMKKEVDHLTGNRSNNSLYALALVHRETNTSVNWCDLISEGSCWQCIKKSWSVIIYSNTVCFWSCKGF